MSDCCGKSDTPRRAAEEENTCCQGARDSRAESTSLATSDGKKSSCCGVSAPQRRARSTTAEAARVIPTTGTLTFADRWDHFLARIGVRRMEHRVAPGLYALGRPAGESPVFVTANYTLSFDALRSGLSGMDAYIMVLDTKGVNVWCSAGKGTFGTDEVVQRAESVRLKDIVSHRTLILPQLGAAGVSAHEVTRRSGFRVEYGPVRAVDIPQYINTRTATPEMRRVGFGVTDRLILIPVELASVLVPMLILTILFLFAGGPMPAAGALAAFLAGTVLFPVLLPWLPTRDFSVKGLFLGAVVALPFVLAELPGVGRPMWPEAGWALVYLLTMMPVTAYLALNFTGCTTFTSRTGVRREIFSYIPAMAIMLGGGIVLAVVLIVVGSPRGT
jgi:hypothetical protein